MNIQLGWLERQTALALLPVSDGSYICLCLLRISNYPGNMVMMPISTGWPVENRWSLRFQQQFPQDHLCAFSQQEKFMNQFTSTEGFLKIRADTKPLKEKLLQWLNQLLHNFSLMRIKNFQLLLFRSLILRGGRGREMKSWRHINPANVTRCKETWAKFSWHLLPLS